MSKDIRSYFMTTSKKPTKPTAELTAKKRKALQISSDEDDISENSQKSTQIIGKTDKKRRVILSDDENSPKKECPQTNLSKLKDHDLKEIKPVNVQDIFGAEPKRIERKQTSKSDLTKEALFATADVTFEKSVHNLDTKHQLLKVEDETKGIDISKVKTSPKKDQSSLHKSTDTKTPKESTESPSAMQDKNAVELKKEIKSDSEVTSDVKTAESEPSDEEKRANKARLASILYQKYKNRQSVINPGCKEVPKGKPNCLAGLSFLVTGVLESLEREETHKVIENCGGKVSKTAGKRLNYMIVGEEAGPKKLATAQNLGIKIITEDQLFDLIREKSAEIDNAEKSNMLKKNKPKSKVEMKKEKALEKRKVVEVKGDLGSSSEIKKMKFGSSLHEENKTFAQITVGKGERDNLAWVDKYKPTTVKEIIGQQGAASCCVKFRNWLSKWYENHDGNKKLQRPNPYAKNDDGSYFKAALLSGPPGIGKTTTAHLMCKELGFTFVELNASDTRNKRLLHDEVNSMITNTSCYAYYRQQTGSVTKKHALIMDEVDGMAGNEDRGGIQELITLIKNTKVPIICMCNDRNHPKIRSLANYCYDLRFNKPRMEQIKGAMMSICFKEKIKFPSSKIEEIILATNCDIRQTLNHFAILHASKNINLENKIARKDLKLGPWDVVRKVFSADEHKKMTLNDKSDLFFHDYSLGPLFVQQNYLSVAPHVSKDKIMEQVALTADSLSLGDLIDKRIRSKSAWSLLPMQAMYSSVLPGEYMAGHFVGQINFPDWLGKNSTTTQKNRLAQEIHAHTRVKTSGSRLSVRLEYAPFLLDAIVRPLKKGVGGVEKSLNVLKEYQLLKDDIESLVKLTSWPGKKNPMDDIDGKIKAALTRTYNKEAPVYSYSVNAGVKKKRAEVEDDLGLLNEEEAAVLVVDDEENEEDDIEKDPTIKKKKPTIKAISIKNDIDTKKAGPSEKGKKRVMKK